LQQYPSESNGNAPYRPDCAAFPEDARNGFAVVVVVVAVVFMERVDFRVLSDRLDFPDFAECESSSRRPDPPLQIGHTPVTW
jgi:hypothetical protein